MKNNKVILVVRDGWGYKADPKEGEVFEHQNAIKLADTRHTDALEEKYPTILLNASGEAVGLPKGFMGNSEVGHMTIGAGRILEQSLLRINHNIESGEFLRNKEILGLIQNIKEHDSQLHLMILMQDAGVHAEIEHLFETLRFCKKEGLHHDQVILHLITDGRDSEPTTAIAFLAEVAEHMEEMGVGNVGTISGRYYAMDRNKNDKRTQKYFDAMFYANSEEMFSCGMEKIDSLYKKDITDEFLPPMVKEGYEGVGENDSVFFLNFRKDRAIQVSEKISEKMSQNFLTMTHYSQEINSRVVFADLEVDRALGEVLERESKKQLRISETEKYAHVTFFFDGGVVKDYKDKKQILINSPDVATYDLQPEMSSEELTETLLAEIRGEQEYDLVVVNYPNPDMVSHSGKLDAAIKAIEKVDQCVEKVVTEGLKQGYTVMLTADHGNAEEVSEKHRSHTANKVPFTIVSPDFENKKEILKEGDLGLGNIAATILECLGIKKPQGMFDSLLK